MPRLFAPTMDSLLSQWWAETGGYASADEVICEVSICDRIGVDQFDVRMSMLSPAGVWADGREVTRDDLLVGMRSGLVDLLADDAPIIPCWWARV